MKVSRPVLYSVGVLAAIAAVGALTSPKLAAAIRAAYVEVVLPSKPFQDSTLLVNDVNFTSLGPNTGTLGITNITLTNYDSTAQSLQISQTAGSGSDCKTAYSYANPSSSNNTHFIVQPYSTLVIPYPSPWVVSNVAGQTCIGAFVNSPLSPNKYVRMDVTGFVN